MFSLPSLLRCDSYRRRGRLLVALVYHLRLYRQAPAPRIITHSPHSRFLPCPSFSFFSFFLLADWIYPTLFSPVLPLCVLMRRHTNVVPKKKSLHLLRLVRHRPPLPNQPSRSRCKSSSTWSATSSHSHSVFGNVGPWGYSRRAPAIGSHSRVVGTPQRFRCFRDRLAVTVLWQQHCTVLP